MALDRETVVRSALRVLDEVGLDGLTLRKIATELGVQAPALAPLWGLALFFLLASPGLGAVVLSRGGMAVPLAVR